MITCPLPPPISLRNRSVRCKENLKLGDVYMLVSCIVDWCVNHSRASNFTYLPGAAKVFKSKRSNNEHKRLFNLGVFLGCEELAQIQIDLRRFEMIQAVSMNTF